MKRKWKGMLAGMAAALLLGALPASCETVQETAGEENTAVWTVMVYLCGSDLESKYGFASGNLAEMLDCQPYLDTIDLYAKELGDALPDSADRNPGKVNVVVETGGCREWHAQEYGMDISADSLQRWHLQTPETIDLDSLEENRFVEDEALPLASMAEPETLSSFIRWGAETYPAQKYALVLWDHGGGSKTGLFVDELFDADIMYLDELGQAMDEGGVFFETVLLDACMMANLETACMLKEHAAWMVASEALVAGKGTAIREWLQQLFAAPFCDGEMLGRWICDMTQIKYANEEDEQAQTLLTWSVIDLSLIDRVAEQFDRFFAACGICYEQYPLLMHQYTLYLNSAEDYGDRQANMYDLAGPFYSQMASLMMDSSLYEDMLQALQDVVVYALRGTGRSAARGLSFCYASNLSPGELDIYARNCPSPHYLAFLDAITPAWSAPDEVYEAAEPLTDIRELEFYQVEVNKRMSSNGTPGVHVEKGELNALDIRVDLYRYNEETGNTLWMGATRAYPDPGGDIADLTYCIYDPWKWLTVEGEHCCAELIRQKDDTMLVNVLVRIGTENGILRCGYDAITEECIVYGLWEGYDMDSIVFNRNVKSLSQLAGQQFCLLYPVEGSGDTGSTFYEESDMLEMFRSLEIDEKPLPLGTYYLQYEITDMFMRNILIDRIEMVWDGQTFALAPGETWEGTVTLTLPES